MLFNIATEFGSRKNFQDPMMWMLNEKKNCIALKIIIILPVAAC